eukprot:jgi/Tetstr1/455960/TSEL_042741.t1
MNSEARGLAAAQRLEAAEFPGGAAAFRVHAAKHLRVKTVVKESHASPISCLALNTVDGPANSRLFATVGKDQATVYDGEHVGQNVGVVVHFQNVETEFSSGGELGVCAWVSSKGVTAHKHGDAILAVAGKDPNISIISVAEGSVIRLLQEHKAEVVDMCGCAAKPGWLASVCKDGEVRLWDVASGASTALGRASVKDATSVAFSPDGAYLVLGCRRGGLKLVQLGGLSAVPGAGAAGQKRKAAGAVELPAEAAGLEAAHEGMVDCVAFLGNGRLATKSVEGRMHVWDMTARTAVASWRVPSCSLAADASRSRFGADPDGAFITVGNAHGDLYIYDAASGARMAYYEHLKVSAPMKAAAVAASGYHVLTVLGNGFIFRYQYMPSRDADKDAEQAAADAGNKENATADNGAVVSQPVEAA